MQTLQLGLIDLGLVQPKQQSLMYEVIRAQHARFLIEAQTAHPISGFIGVIEANEQQAKILTELRNTDTQEVLLAMVHDMELTIPATETVELPPYASPRGVSGQPSPYGDLSLQEALARGFVSIGRGIIQQSECERGSLAWYQYMGRVSDSIPNFWARLSPSKNLTEEEKNQGRVVLEYRSDYYSLLDHNDRFEIVSGLTDIKEKTQNFRHLIFNLTTQACVASCTVTSITMDLTTRKAVPTSATTLQNMKSLLVD